MSSTLPLLITNADGARLAGAWAHLGGATMPTVDASGNVEGDWDERQANKDGYIAFQKVDTGPATVLVRMPGYVDQPLAPITMPHDALIEVVLQRAPVTLSPLTRIEGHRMVNERGEKVYGRGASEFLLFKKFLDGEDITPVLRQLQTLPGGCNLIRVMGMFESLGGFNPKAYGGRYYQQIQPFCALCESFGIYVLWTACAATGAWMTQDEAYEHIRRSRDETGTLRTPFSPVNEQGQHHNSIERVRVCRDLINHDTMQGRLFDTGSFGADEPCEPPFGTHAVLHVNRRYSNSVRDCCILDHPNHVNDHLEVGLDEPDRYGDEGNTSVAQAAEAAGTAYTALFFVFHSMQGERGEVLRGNTLDCAIAAFTAMRGH